jgi:hypothetical protein
MSMGHGHVTPNPDGSKARCGGPAMCDVCRGEFSMVYQRPWVAANDVFSSAPPPRTEKHLPMLSVPGVQLTLQTITGDCRAARGDDGAVDEAVRRAAEILRGALKWWAPGSGAKFHVVVTLEKPQSPE